MQFISSTITITIPADCMLAGLEETKRGWIAYVRLRRGYPTSALGQGTALAPQAAIDAAVSMARERGSTIEANRPGKYEGLSLKINL